MRYKKIIAGPLTQTKIYFSEQKSSKLVSEFEGLVFHLHELSTIPEIEGQTSQILLQQKLVLCEKLLKLLEPSAERHSLDKTKHPSTVIEQKNCPPTKKFLDLNDAITGMFIYRDNDPVIIKAFNFYAEMDLISCLSLSTIAMSRKLESISKLGKIHYLKLFLNHFESKIQNHLFAERPLATLPLITNFYNFKDVIPETSFESYIDCYRLLSEKFKPSMPYLTYDIPKSNTTLTSHLSLEKYVWLFCENIPKKHYIEEQLNLPRLTNLEKERLAIQYLLSQIKKGYQPTLSLSSKNQYAISRQLHDIYLEKTIHSNKNKRIELVENYNKTSDISAPFLI